MVTKSGHKSGQKGRKGTNKVVTKSGHKKRTETGKDTLFNKYIRLKTKDYIPPSIPPYANALKQTPLVGGLFCNQKRVCVFNGRKWGRYFTKAETGEKLTLRIAVKPPKMPCTGF